MSLNRRTFCADPARCGRIAARRGRDTDQPRERLVFDQDWKFLLGDPPAPKPLPSTRLLADPGSPARLEHRRQDGPQERPGGSGGFFPDGRGLVPPRLHRPGAWNGKRVGVEFEGVYMNATVYINGHELGTHPYGYTSFTHDLTPHLKLGGANVLAVRVDQPSNETSAGTPAPASTGTCG